MNESSNKGALAAIVVAVLVVGGILVVLLFGGVGTRSTVTPPSRSAPVITPTGGVSHGPPGPPAPPTR